MARPKNNRIKNPIAVAFGSLGGKKTATRGSEYYKRISKLGKIALRKKKTGNVEDFSFAGQEEEIYNQTLDEQKRNQQIL